MPKYTITVEDIVNPDGDESLVQMEITAVPVAADTSGKISVIYPNGPSPASVFTKVINTLFHSGVLGPLAPIVLQDEFRLRDSFIKAAQAQEQQKVGGADAIIDRGTNEDAAPTDA